jgi:hypothetical protein
MKSLIFAAVAALGLGGCVAVPAPYSYYPDNGYYYPAPAVGVGVYSGPGYYGSRRHYRHRW